MEYTKVGVSDWYGVVGIYKIVNLVKRDDNKFSCTFINSEGDTEKRLVHKQSLLKD